MMGLKVYQKESGQRANWQKMENTVLLTEIKSGAKVS